MECGCVQGGSKAGCRKEGKLATEHGDSRRQQGCVKGEAQQTAHATRCQHTDTGMPVCKLVGSWCSKYGAPLLTMKGASVPGTCISDQYLRGMSASDCTSARSSAAGCTEAAEAPAAADAGGAGCSSSAMGCAVGAKVDSW